MSSRRSARIFGRAIQSSSTSGCEILIIWGAHAPRVSASSPVGRIRPVADRTDSARGEPAKGPSPLRTFLFLICSLLDALRRAHRFDLHPDQSFAAGEIVSPDAKRDIPRRRWQWRSRAVEIDGPTVIIPLPDAQNKMLIVDHARRRDRMHLARQKQRLRISIAKRLQHFVPAQKIDIDVSQTELMIESQARLQIILRQ